MSLETKLVRHAVTTQYDDLPEQAKEAARRVILWVLGISVAGAGARGSDKVLAVIRELGRGCPGDATIIGYGEKAPALLAGFANGVYAKTLEYEDKIWFDNTHGLAVGVGVVPAAFAMAEHLAGVSGRTFLTAIAVATDVQVRMVTGSARSPSMGFNSTYMYSHFGAAIAAGRLLGLTEEQMMDAMGIAYTQVAGTGQANYERSLAVWMQMGFCARNGMFAATMAKAGIDGPHQFLTGRAGLYPTFFKVYDEAAILDGLGSEFCGTRLGFKAYPCGAVAHPALDAVIQVKKDHKFEVEQVAAVDIYGTPSMALMSDPLEEKRRPKNHVDQVFSLPWAVAGALAEGKLSLSHFREEALKEPAKAALSQKVTVHMDPQHIATYAIVTLSDGRKLRSAPVIAPKGTPDNPLSLEEVVERYRECVMCGPKPLPVEKTERAKDLVLKLQDVKDVTEVIRLLG